MTRYWGLDNSITVAAIQHRSWQDWWPHDRISPPVMTRLRYSWLMDTSPRPAEVIAENAQPATALFSCVNFVISACLTIPDQYSIKELFFALSWSVVSWGKRLEHRHEIACCCLPKKRQECNRGKEWKRKQGWSPLSDSGVSCRHSGMKGEGGSSL